MDAYQKLFGFYSPSETDATKFRFGKYKGQYVEDIWENDREYINWLSDQEWLAEYMDENDMIHELLHMEEEHKN